MSLAPPLRLVPQAGPAVWSGPALTPADWMVPVGAEEAAELEAALADGGAAAPAPPRLGPLLRGVAERLATGRGFALLRGLPLERFAALGGPAAVLRAIGARFGAALPDDPAPAVPDARRGLAVEADRGDVALLLCDAPSGADGAAPAVTLLSAPALHNALLKADRAALATLHTGLPRRDGGEPVAVFSAQGGAFAARLDRAVVAEDTAALEALARAAEGQGLDLPLSPGDVLVRNPTLVWVRAVPPAGVAAGLLLRLQVGGSATAAVGG